MESIEERIADETKMMVFKSLTDLGPKYMYNMFSKDSHFTERDLRNTTTDLRRPLRKSTTNIVSLKESNQTIFDKQSIRNEMNEYFCSIGEKLAADIVHTSSPLLSKEININGDGRIFDFREITEGDIHEAICRIKVQKSFGKDSFSGYFLNIAFPYISRILMLIFNTSIETSTFPVS